jgi:holo-[acyl-carrier protein] synthase
MAKRFAAKEALGKALGCGIRAPLVLTAIQITHDAAGKPGFRLDDEADALVGGAGRVAHLSISDEQDHAIAFVVVEQA